MKKVFLLLAIVALVSSAGTVRTAGATSIRIATSAGPGTPEEVMNTFNQFATDFMNLYFPENPAYDASAVSWDKVKREWVCSGMIYQVGGNGAGIHVISGRYENNGDFIEIFYNAVYQ